MEFFVPLHVQDVELAKNDRYYVIQIQAVDRANDDEAIALLRRLEDQVLQSKDDDECPLLDQDCFDLSYSFTKYVRRFVLCMRMN